MPTFTAIALDRWLEFGASKSVDKSAPTSMPVPNTKLEKSSAPTTKPAPTSMPVPNSKMERRNSASTTKKKAPGPQLKPALYTTPEVKPLPDSPSSFPPSPYIVNHKRRGPRLLKSFSEANVQSKQEVPDDEMVNGKPKTSSSAGDLQATFTNPEPVLGEHVNGVCDSERGSNVDDLGSGHRDAENRSIANILHRESNILTTATLNSDRDGEGDDFFDPQDSMSFTSNTDGEDNTAAERTVKFSTPGAEFFDAWEELSSESGSQTTTYNIEAELREIRLSLLMEIEKRKQAEESLNIMQSQWQSIREMLSLVGIILPADLTTVAQGEQLNSDPMEDVCQQVYVARFVADTIGRGTARAEAEMELEAQFESKNFEIARLMERIHFYEIVNQEMSQRNQEAVEMARRERQKRRRSRQRWVWGSVATAIALGTGAIAWTCLPGVRGSSSDDLDLVPEHNDAAK